MKPLRVAVVGGGWAGMAAAVGAAQDGHAVTVFEASRQWGGRARALPGSDAQGHALLLDNGQHILIGAYRQTLALLRTVGVDTRTQLLRLPLSMQFADGSGLALPDWPMPLDVLGGILRARGWSRAEKWALLRTTGRWQRAGFQCAAQATVQQLCEGLPDLIMRTLIEPLCVSALNTPMERASGQVFLRVLRDALLGGWRSSNLLIPRSDLSSLFPGAAAVWLRRHGARALLATRIEHIAWEPGHSQPSWLINGEAFDRVVWATSAGVAARALEQAQGPHAGALADWAQGVHGLAHEGIATVYAQAGSCRLARPMLALHSGAGAGPAQFVFDRGQLGGPQGLLAFVVSACQDGREALQEQVLQQARTQLAAQLQGQDLQPLQTVVERRATFACLPGLKRPAQSVAPGFEVCGDYVQGPYPATLEGAVRSGLAAARAIRATPRAGPTLQAAER